MKVRRRFLRRILLLGIRWYGRTSSKAHAVSAFAIFENNERIEIGHRISLESEVFSLST